MTPRHFIAAGALAVSAVYPLCLILLAISGFRLPNSDFFAFWSFGRFLAGHPAAAIYDTSQLFAFQDALAGSVHVSHYPFPYAPWFLLLLRPLAWLSFNAAWIVWTLLGLSLYLAVLVCLVRPPLWCLLWAVTAPSSLFCVLAGQNGFLSASLFAGGLLLMDARPTLAGVLLGILIYKPQLFILVPIILLLRWRLHAIISGCLTVCAMTLLSLLVFGPEVWCAWLDQLPHETAALSLDAGRRLELMPGITALLLSLTHASPVIRSVQVSVMLGACLILTRYRNVQIAVLLPIGALLTILTTPYAFLYDLPLVTVSLLVLIAHEWPGVTEKKGLARLCLYTAAILTPLVYLGHSAWLKHSVCLIYSAALGVILWRYRIQPARCVVQESMTV